MLTIRAANLRVLHRGIYSFGATSALRLRPSGVISKAQAMTRATGKQRTVSNTTSLTIQFGIRRMEKLGWRPGPGARRQLRKQLRPCKRGAASARQESFANSSQEIC